MDDNHYFVRLLIMTVSRHTDYPLFAPFLWRGQCLCTADEASTSYSNPAARPAAGPWSETAYTASPFFSSLQWRSVAIFYIHKKKRTQIV